MGVKISLTKKLLFQSIFKFFLGVFLVGASIFVSAGTFNYYNAWLFMAVLFIPMFCAGIVLMIKNPKLLESRLDAKERLKNQDVIIKLSGLMFFVGFVIAGLDFRFKWIVLSRWISYVFLIIFLLGYIVFAEVLRENSHLSRVIKVEKDQKIIDSGLYGIIRHPMYTSTIILFLSMPLILGSIISFFVFLIYPILIYFRILGEEKFLKEKLVGYTEYMKKVKYRLIPFIW